MVLIHIIHIICEWKEGFNGNVCKPTGNNITDNLLLNVPSSLGRICKGPSGDKILLLIDI